MSEPIKKRHPRLAVWRGRAAEYGVAVLGFAVAVFNALTGSWDVVPPWLLVGAIALVFQRRLEHTWSWAWRESHEDTLRRVMPHVQLDRSNLVGLHEAFMATGPTWRQRQDEMSQIDYPATMKASMEQLERTWAEMDEQGPT